MAIFSASNLAESLMVKYINILLIVLAGLANLMLLGGLYGKQQVRVGMALLFVIKGLNLFLDIILVYGFGMTIGGVAYISVGAQWSGFDFIIFWIARVRPGRLG